MMAAKRKRTKLTFHQKYEILQEVKAGGVEKDVAAKYGIDRSVVSKI